MNTAAATVETELLEELAADPAHETHRQEYGDDGERGGDHREADLVRRLHGGAVSALAHAHMTHDIFNFDDGIVDQHTRHQRQGQQRYLVERKTHHLHEGKGGNRRKGNGQGRNQGSAPIAQEKPDHGDGQDRSLDQCLQGRMVGLDRVIDGRKNLLNMQRRIVLPDLFQFLGNAFSGGDVRDALGLVQGERGRGSAVQPRQTACFRDAIVDIGNLAQAHRFASRSG